MLLVGASEAQETGEEAIKVVVDESPVAAAKESNDEIEKLVSKREIDGDEILQGQLKTEDQLVEDILMDPLWWKGERRGRWGRRRWGGRPMWGGRRWENRRWGERRGRYYGDEEDSSLVNDDQEIDDQTMEDQVIEDALMGSKWWREGRRSGWGRPMWGGNRPWRGGRRWGGNRRWGSGRRWGGRRMNGDEDDSTLIEDDQETDDQMELNQVIEELLMDAKRRRGGRGRGDRYRGRGYRREERRGGYYGGGGYDDDDQEIVETDDQMDQVMEELLMDARWSKNGRQGSIRRKGAKRGNVMSEELIRDLLRGGPKRSGRKGERRSDEE